MSSYNKTAEHEVVYYKECQNKEDMNLVEKIVLRKLDPYREKANRYRIVLPLDKSIDLFIDAINQYINTLNV